MVNLVNIDFLVSGCNTRCRHCYVNGGPGPLMPAEDALLCIERLDLLASCLSGEVSFTLDHEPMDHPEIAGILHGAAGTQYIQYYHHGMTSGLGLMGRQDRHAVIQSYFDCGYSEFGITIHGSGPHHDEITRRQGAYDAAVRAADFLKAEGAELSLSLMLNRFFPQDAESITALIEYVQPSYVYFAIPIYTPHGNMGHFEPYRAALEDIQSLRGYLARWGQEEAKILSQAEQNTVLAAAERLSRGPALQELFAKEQEELYLSLHQDCMLYVGNSGAETRCLGDLRSMDVRAAAETIAALPGNRDYGAFYDADALPTDEALRNTLKQLPRNLVYGDFESVVYRGLAELNIPTNLIECNTGILRKSPTKKQKDT